MVIIQSTSLNAHYAHHDFMKDTNNRLVAVIMKLGGGWTFAVFGFISAALSTIPFLLFFFGSKLRARSSHNPHMASDMMPMTLGRDEEMQRMEMSNNL